MDPMYSMILEDVQKSDAILEDVDTVFRTDDAQIYSGYANTGNIFSISTKAPEKWLVPSESFVRIVFSLADAAGAARQAFADNAATLISGGLHLFSKIRLIVDDNVVETVLKPGYCHMLEHLLTTSVDQLQSVAQNEWIYIDDGGIVTGQYASYTLATNGASINSTETSGLDVEVNDFWGLADNVPYLSDDGIATHVSGVNPKFNKGFAARWRRTRPIKNAAGADIDHDVELAIPVTRLFAFFADIRPAFRGIKFEIEFTKNTDYAEICHGKGAYTFDTTDYPAAAAVSTVIKKVEWVVKTVIPNTLILEQVQRQLQSGDRVRKVFTSTTCYDITRTPAAPGLYDVDWRIQSTGRKIDRVAIAFQRQAQYSAQNDPSVATNANHANGGTFTYFNNIPSLEIRFGSTIMPHERYDRMQFQNTADGLNYTRNYVDFLEAGRRWQTDDGCLVSYESFRHLYPIFVFDLSQIDLNAMNTTSEDLRLVATVDVANTNPFRILAMVSYEYPVDMYGVNGRLAIELPQ